MTRNEPEGTDQANRRQRLGQHFTDRDVAKFMVDWVLQGDAGSLYDPGFGMGAFLEPLSAWPQTTFHASEIDPTVLVQWEAANGQKASFVTREDYLLSWGRTRRNIVCNPPYHRFQNFENRDAFGESFLAWTGLRLSGYTNMASAFLLKSLHELDGRGRLAYIMPLEFLNTGYGTAVKSRLVEDGHLKAVISMRCEREVFPDCTTTVGIILYDAMNVHQHVEFHVAESIGDLASVLQTEPMNRVEREQLDPSCKWMPYLEGPPAKQASGDLVKLETYGRFSRGIATGANEFFKLRPSQARALGIAPQEYIHCITRSAQLNRMTFSQRDLSELLDSDAPVLLFAPGKEHTPAAEAYIKRGEADGFHQRYLTRNRDPWYACELRDPTPIMVNVFSRRGYKIVRNQSDAVSLNCYHGFRPNEVGKRHVDELFLFLASGPGRELASKSMRKYGDALDKFEPNDLNSTLVPSPTALESMPGDLVREAMQVVETHGSLPETIDRFFADAVAGVKRQ